MSDTVYTDLVEKVKLWGYNAFEAGILPDETEWHTKDLQPYLQRAWWTGYEQARKEEEAR